MATTDNKVLTGAGVEKLSQLVKNAIAQGGGGGTEYSAGSGISIDNGQIINKMPGANGIIPLLLGKLDMYSYSSIGINDTIDNVITAFRAGRGARFARSKTMSNPTATLGAYYLVGIDSTGAVSYTSLSDQSSYTFSQGYVYYQLGNLLVRLSTSQPYNFIKSIGYDNTNSGLSATKLHAAIDELAAKETPLATTETPGTVIPDGTTITIDSNGVISSQGGSGGSSLPSDPVVDGSYKLVNTVATVEGTQTATQTWEEDAGYTATNGIQIDNGVIKPGIDIMKGNMLLPLLTSYLNGSNISNNWVNIRALRNYASRTIDDIKLSLETFGFFITPYVNSEISYTWEDIFELLGLDTSTTYYEGYMEQYSSSSTGYYISSNSSSTLSLSSKPTKDCIHFYLNNTANTNPGNFFFCIPAGYNSSLALAANGKVDMRDTTLTGERYPTINKALIAFQNTRIADTLVSTDTAPTVNNTINWVYK